MAGDQRVAWRAGAVRVARRPPLTYRRAPRPGTPPPAELPRTAGVPARGAPAAPLSEAFHGLRRQIRLTVDHRLRCGQCRRPPQRRRCADGERLEALRREADRTFGARQHHRQRTGRHATGRRGHPADIVRSRGGC